MHKVKNVVSVSPWKARMKHMFTLTVLIPNARSCDGTDVSPQKCIPSGAYFLTNSLHSTIRKYTMHKLYTGKIINHLASYVAVCMELLNNSINE